MTQEEEAGIDPERVKEQGERLMAEIRKVIVGQDEIVQNLLISLFARGHCLLIGVPGLAKTLLVRTLSQALSWDFRRIQFTPDLMPSDILGTELLETDPATGQRHLRFVPGPDLRQRRARRRDQPHAAQDAGGAARSHAGAERHDRRQDAADRAPRSSSSPPRTPSSRRAPIRCPKPSSTALCSA